MEYSRYRQFVLLSLLLLTFNFFDLSAQNGNGILFRNANLVPMVDDTIYTSYDLLIKNSEIIGIGKNLKKPKGFNQVNCEGKYIIPGLADMHVHIERFENEEDLKLFPLFGVTTVRNMDGRNPCPQFFRINWMKT